MKVQRAVVASTFALVGLLISACGQPAAPVASTTGAPAAQTATAKPNFPLKPITIIVPFAAGGGTDVAARALAPLLGKQLGTSVEIVNTPGASTQAGLTQLVQSQPDGYTLGAVVLPTAITTYIEKDRAAGYSRASFSPIGSMYVNPLVFSVLASSPYKTLQDVINAAKSSPGKITVGTAGLGGTNHLVGLQLAQLAGVKFSFVHFNGSAPLVTALLGGHVDVATSLIPDILPNVKANAVRPLALAAKQESSFLPGIKTVDALGFTSPAYFAAAVALVAPSGTPQGVIEMLVASLKAAVSTDEYKKWAADSGSEIPYLGPSEFAKLWADQETELGPLMQLAQQ